jgi:hypothetical protein
VLTGSLLIVVVIPYPQIMGVSTLRRSASVGLVLCTITFAGATGAARADGDPASDVLYSTDVFLPYEAPIPKAVKQQLTETVKASRQAGYRIKVAVIGSTYDLGSVTSLYFKPQRYANFLWVELSGFYKGPLLVAMPNGFGFFSGKRSKKEQTLLRRLPLGHDANSFVRGTTNAVVKLAAANGHRFEAPSIKG